MVDEQRHAVGLETFWISPLILGWSATNSRNVLRMASWSRATPAGVWKAAFGSLELEERVHVALAEQALEVPDDILRRGRPRLPSRVLSE